MRGVGDRLLVGARGFKQVPRAHREGEWTLEPTLSFAIQRDRHNIAHESAGMTSYKRAQTLFFSSTLSVPYARLAKTECLGHHRGYTRWDQLHLLLLAGYSGPGFWRWRFEPSDAPVRESHKAQYSLLFTATGIVYMAQSGGFIYQKRAQRSKGENSPYFEESDLISPEHSNTMHDALHQETPEYANDELEPCLVPASPFITDQLHKSMPMNREAKITRRRRA
ncbi:predicted protein [Histoplasma capsulatum var. duboisii H88]|uniref:Predicted protein n=1 Tax=Ajellomyces capsulatus (strain H88) TaxID=544711 RepID=F0UDT6_AJEC8|nr:predicted protein [Histoplasma capsulatum var. duboisii H88]